MTSLGTRERLLDAASRLFAEHGFRGASVRDLCDHARANPGAVSYHFGGKRHLYRTVLRHAGERLAEAALAEASAPPTDLEPADRALRVILALDGQLGHNPVAARLLLRDLADGGAVAIEVLTPLLRAAVAALRPVLGADDDPETLVEARLLLLSAAAPLLLVHAAWPVLQAAFELDPAARPALLLSLMTTPST